MDKQLVSAQKRLISVASKLGFAVSITFHVQDVDINNTKNDVSKQADFVTIPSLDDQLQAWEQGRVLDTSMVVLWGRLAGLSEAYVRKWLREKLSDGQLRRVKHGKYMKGLVTHGV